MKVLIRHAEKSYYNGKPNNISDHKHDPPLTEKGILDVINKTSTLIQTYGLPTKIITSPFLRCRQTAILLRLTCLEYIKNQKIQHNDIEICIDPIFSEYLGNHNQDTLDLNSETGKYEIPHPENWITFELRMFHACKLLRTLQDDNIWIITHGVVMSTVRQFITQDRSRTNYNYLDTLVFTD